MMDEEPLFIPVTCASCSRVSVVTLSRPLLRAQLKSGAPIDLYCAYDDFAWKAGPGEVTRMTKLLNESERVASSGWLRLRSQPAREMRN